MHSVTFRPKDDVLQLTLGVGELLVVRAMPTMITVIRSDLQP